MSTKQHLRWLLLCLIIGLTIQTGCGPQIYIHPLEGEDPEIVAMIGAEAGLDPESETIRATKECYRLLKKGNMPAFWARLSNETQTALEKRAELGNTNALEMLHTALFPASNAGQVKSIHVDLEALFFVRKPTRFSSRKPPRTEGAVTNVRVTNGKREERRVQLKLTKNKWMLHHTSFSDLPIVVPAPRALLPGHTSLSPTNTAPPPEPPPKPSAPSPPPSEQPGIDKDF